MFWSSLKILTQESFDTEKENVDKWCNLFQMIFLSNHFLLSAVRWKEFTISLSYLLWGENNLFFYYRACNYWVTLHVGASTCVLLTNSKEQIQLRCRLCLAKPLTPIWNLADIICIHLCFLDWIIYSWLVDNVFICWFNNLIKRHIHS